MLELVMGGLLMLLLLLGIAGCEPLPPGATPTTLTPATAHISVYTPATGGTTGLKTTSMQIINALKVPGGVTVTKPGDVKQLPHLAVWENLNLRGGQLAQDAGRALGRKIFDQVEPTAPEQMYATAASQFDAFNTQLRSLKGGPLWPNGWSLLDHLLDEWIQRSPIGDPKTGNIPVTWGPRAISPGCGSSRFLTASNCSAWPPGEPIRPGTSWWSVPTVSWTTAWQRIDQRYGRPTLDGAVAGPSIHAATRPVFRVVPNYAKLKTSVDAAGYALYPNVKDWVSFRDPTGRDVNASSPMVDPRQVQRYWQWRTWWELVAERWNFELITEGATIDEAQRDAASARALLTPYLFALAGDLIDRLEVGLDGELSSTRDETRTALIAAWQSWWDFRTVLLVPDPPDPPSFLSQVGSKLKDPRTYVRIAAAYFSAGGSEAVLAAAQATATLAAEKLATDVVAQVLRTVGITVEPGGAELALPFGAGNIAFTPDGSMGVVAGDGALVIGTDGKMIYSGPTTPLVVVPPPSGVS